MHGELFDFDEDPDDEHVITRVVYEEITITKGSLIEKPVTKITYKEWTDKTWTVYRQANDSEKSNDTSKGVEVVVESQGTHDFKVCPWIRFRPPFPIEDIAELNRALFNINSLLDEELYNCTFTQKWITGEKPDNIAGTEGGTGNTIVVPNIDAKIGVFGAVSGQSVALMDRINHLRDGIYMIVSMEGSSTKNVAETAEKKEERS